MKYTGKVESFIFSTFSWSSERKKEKTALEILHEWMKSADARKVDLLKLYPFLTKTESFNWFNW